MTEQENVRTIQEAYASFQRGDVQAVLNVLTDDVEWVTPGPTSILPLAGHRRGRDEVAQFFSLLNGSEEVEQFEPQEYVAQGNNVVVFVKYRSRIKSTGHTADADLVHVFTVRDGKIAAFREYYDTAAAVEAYRTTPEQENVRTIQEAYASFQRGDVQAVLNVLTDDVEWVTPGPTGILPLAGHRQGRDEVAQFFSLLNGSEEVEQFKPQQYVAQGNKVVAFVKYRSRIKSTGHTADADLVHVFTVRDGKIAAFREYYDTAAAVEAYRRTTPEQRAAAAS